MTIKEKEVSIHMLHEEIEIKCPLLKVDIHFEVGDLPELKFKTIFVKIFIGFSYYENI